MVAVNCLGAFIIGPTPALVWSMYADCADYGEWKSGRRATALVFSGSQFGQKMGLAIGAGLSGYILSLFGFVANQLQSDSAITGIRLMFSAFPAVLVVTGTAFIFFYKLDRDAVNLIETDLKERHKRQNESE